MLPSLLLALALAPTAPAIEGTISGKLLRPGNAPVAGVVTVRPIGGETTTTVTCDAATGEFVTEPLADGSYLLTFTPPADSSLTTAREVAVAGDADVTAHLSEAVTIKARVQRSKIEKIRERNAEVHAYVQSDDGHCSVVAPCGDEGVFTLPGVAAESDSVLFVATDDGWISRPRLLGPPSSATGRAISRPLSEGARLTLIGFDDAPWTEFDVECTMGLLYRLRVPRGESRVVTVQARPITVLADTPADDPEGMRRVRIAEFEPAAGDTVSLADADHWSDLDVGSCVSLALMRESDPLDSKALTSALETTFEYATIKTAGEAPGITIVSFDRDSFLTVAHMPVPVPNGEASAAARTTSTWPNGAEEAKEHASHYVIAYVGLGDAIHRALMTTQATRAVIAAAGENALGTICVGPDQAVRADLFMSLTEDATYEDPPLLAWVRFQFARDDESEGMSLYTIGLESLDTRDIELTGWKDDTNDLFDFVYNLASYVATNGPVIRDGDTFGSTEEERFKVRIVPSLLDDERKVYRVDM